MKWTEEEKTKLEQSGLKTFGFVAYCGPHEIVKELRPNHANQEVPFYMTVVEGLERGESGELGMAWTHLGYSSLDDAITKVKRA